MKKIVFIMLLGMGISFNAIGQSSEGDVEIGFNFGFNFSNIIYTEGIGGSMDGFNFAGSFDYYFSNRWSLKGKLIYDQKGWDGIYDYYEDDYYYEDGFTSSKYDQPYQLNYITVPIMANWHFAKKRNWYLNFGPYVGFLLNAKNDLKGNSIENELESTDFGIAFGIGVKIPLKNNFNLFFEFERQNGFKNIFNNYSNYDNRYFYQDDYGINLRGSLNFGFIYQFNKANSKVK